MLTQGNYCPSCGRKVEFQVPAASRNVFFCSHEKKAIDLGAECNPFAVAARPYCPHCGRRRLTKGYLDASGTFRAGDPDDITEVSRGHWRCRNCDLAG
ncbi:MAG: hypothetical protein HY340_02035 [Candidatus Kerfeldbacteria bacterium]|nr:hypothetical protein [Candidatus Kerfeldbacteria bacterium]